MNIRFFPGRIKQLSQLFPVFMLHWIEYIFCKPCTITYWSCTYKLVIVNADDARPIYTSKRLIVFSILISHEWLAGCFRKVKTPAYFTLPLNLSLLTIPPIWQTFYLIKLFSPAQQQSCYSLLMHISSKETWK